ncbi:MAG: ROK family protein [Bacteroidota bacterium]|nr:ROK family protein [Flavisolibacter sp.]MDQ3843225.1 ROK family protein [Bacteroidota bacterium]
MENASGDKILTIDIGGSKIKATILNAEGKFIMDYKKNETPIPANPQNIVNTIKELVRDFPEYDKISVGFPGYVKDGVVKTAPNLDNEAWKDFDLQKELSTVLGKPAIVVNDADLQGIGLVSGKGLELVITLGTGCGTALLYNGKLLPHLELSHHPITKSKDYDQYIGEKELLRIGKERWNARMQRVLSILKTVFNYDRLYISGGNADELTFKLDDNISIVTNKEGIKGGARLWQQHNNS